MKLKKLFAGVVAVAMMATMAMPSFAAGNIWGTNGKVHTPDDNGQVNITKEYKLIGSGTSPDETFNFDIQNDFVADSSIKNVDDMPTPSISGVDFKGETGRATTAGNKKDITISFGTGANFIYKNVGVYSYTITEETPDKPTAGVNYDNGTVYMKVTVVNKSDYTGYEIKSVTFHKNGKKLGEGDAAFENTYSAAELDVTKTVKGNMGNKDQYFDFDITLNATDAESKTYNTSYTLTGGQYTGENALTLTLGEAKTIKLKHGENVKIENLPYGVTYTVTEHNYTITDGYDPAEYVYTVDEAKNEDAVKTIKGTVNKVEVINTKGDVIDTGVILDNAPYMLMLAVVAAGAMTLVIKKRREEE